MQSRVLRVRLGEGAPVLTGRAYIELQQIIHFFETDDIRRHILSFVLLDVIIDDDI